MPELLLTENRGAVRLLTMNRPEKRNALNTELTQKLLDALRAADADATVNCVVLAGAGPGFCAGADMGEFKDLTPEHKDRVDARAELTMQLHLVFSQMATPVITAINGAAMGGGAGLAIAADLAVMGESAKLGYPEVKHGIVAATVLANLIKQVGRKAAFEIVATGAPIDAQRALALGMVNRVVPDADLLPATLALAETLAAMSWPAMATTKRLFHEVADLPLPDALRLGREANKRMRGFKRTGS